MWYITPAKHLQLDDYKHISRVAMHIGNHTHPPKFIHKAEHRKLVRVLLEETVKRSPSTRPSVLKSETIKALQDIFEEKVANIITKQEADNLNETLAILKDQSLVRSMIQSVKKYTHISSDMTMILELKAKTVMPFVQSVLFLGQSLASNERPHIFKMSTSGLGSGIDLIRRMQPGGNLEHSWVLSDVMHRMLDNKWVTMSAHVYDHHFCGLCTIFTCELVSQDTASLGIVWRLMLRVCKENDLENVTFKGFMADNAAAGWNAIRNTFWGGKVNVKREHSDAFHWAQSVERVTKKYIIVTKRTEHKRLLESLRDAGNVIVAFRILEDIKAW
jgi:hypothetical protein